MTKLLIVAAGNGTRNAMFTFNNALPKCLMSVGDKTCLEAIIESYDGLVDEVVVAVQDKHEAAVKDLLNFKKIKATIVSFEEQSYAIASVEKAVKLAEVKDDDDWFINWSDVFVKKMTKPNCDTLFVDTKYQHRNLAYHNGIVDVVSTDDMHGNVPGIFYCSGKTIRRALADNKITGARATFDFDKALAIDQSPDQPLVLSYRDDIQDIGDYDKYNAYMQSIKSDNVCRYFNDVIVDKQIVYKRPKTDKGVELHKIELAYYRKFGNRGTALAKLKGYDAETMTMTLERLKGQTCRAYVDAKPETSKLATVNTLIKKFKQSMQSTWDMQIDIEDTEQDINDAIRNEFFTAIDKRVRPCMNMIEATMAKNDIKSIDGLPVVTFDKLMTAVDNWLNAKMADGAFEAALVHGDPNTDNSMICGKELRFVDPRGYFGNLKTLGLGIKQYDIAKFVYGFSGYGRFNSAEYVATIVDNGDVQTFIGPAEQPGMADVNLFDIKCDDDIKVLVGIIWVKLTSYIINDPVKSVLAYLYGNALLTKLLNIK